MILKDPLAVPIHPENWEVLTPRISMDNRGGRIRQCQRPRRTAAGLWALALWLSLEAAVRLNAALQFDVFLGYDGMLHENNWFPVVCEVANDGPGFNAIFDLRSTGYGGSSQSRRYAIELPTNTRKRFVVPAFAGRYSSWDARLLDERGRVRGEQTGLRPRRDVLARTFLLGALPRTFSGLPGFPEIKNNAGQRVTQPEAQPAAAFLKPELFPDNPIALEGLDALYLSSEKALELKAPQVSALLAWLYNGGHLIVGVEQATDINATDWLRKLVPAEFPTADTRSVAQNLTDWLRSNPGAPKRKISVTANPVDMRFRGGIPPGVRQRTLVPGVQPNKTESPEDVLNPFSAVPEDAKFEEASLMVAVATVHGGEVVHADDGAPLIVRGQRGRGQVTLLTFSPDREPIRAWKNRNWFWARVSQMPLEALNAAEPPNYANQSIDGVFGAMIDSKQVHKLPVGWLLALLLVYLAVIGPVDQYSLKRLNKQMWTWVTFPIYVALFSGLIYFIGYKLRAGETEWNELHLVDIYPNGDRAELRGHTFASVYSPANASYQLVSEQPVASIRGESQGSWGGGQEASRADVEQLSRGFRASVYVPVWTSQLFAYDWWQSGPLPCGAQIQTQASGGLQITVTNRLNRPLTNARLVCRERVYDLGELPAEKTSTFTFVRGQGQTLEAFLGGTVAKAGDFSQAAQERHRAFGADPSQRIWDMPASTTAASFISGHQLSVNSQMGYSAGFLAPNGLDLGDLLDRGLGILIAWDAGHSLAKPIYQFSPRRSQRNTLLRLAVPIQANQ